MSLQAEEYGGYIYQRNSTTFEIGAYSGITLKFIGDPVFEKSPEVPNPSADSHAANKYYVDNQIGSLPSVNLDNYLPLSGGTMTGNLLFTGGDRAIDVLNGNRLRLKAIDASSSGRTFIDIQTNDSSGAEGTDEGYRLQALPLSRSNSWLSRSQHEVVDTQTGLLSTEGRWNCNW